MKKSIYLIIIMLLAIMFIRCEKDDNNPNGNNPTNGLTTAVFNNSLSYGTMTDQDGNTYKTIKIGTQTWMAENLRTTKYRDGSIIPVVTDNTEWKELTTGACCSYGLTADNVEIATYGRLYNYYAATDHRNIAPEGWHLPTDAEWTILITYLGGEAIAGGKLKEAGTKHWTSPNIDANNTSGFTALPNGMRHPSDGTFGGFGNSGHWWAFTGSLAGGDKWLGFNYAMIGDGDFGTITSGLSVRLVMD